MATKSSKHAVQHAPGGHAVQHAANGHAAGGARVFWTGEAAGPDQSRTNPAADCVLLRIVSSYGLCPVWGYGSPVLWKSGVKRCGGPFLIGNGLVDSFAFGKASGFRSTALPLAKRLGSGRQLCLWQSVWGRFIPGRDGFSLRLAGAKRGRIKPIERLVRLSFMHCCTSTCLLSTWWSTTALGRDLVLRGVSRLDAFSGYPVRT